MSWQDLVFGAGQLLFGIALLPALWSDEKPPLFTSLLTGVVLWVFAGAFATMTFWWAAANSFGCGLLWLTLAWQRRWV